MINKINLSIIAGILSLTASVSFAEVTKQEIESFDVTVAGEKLFKFDAPKIADLDVKTKQHFASYVHFVRAYAMHDPRIFLSVQMGSKPLQGELTHGMQLAEQQKGLADGRSELTGPSEVRSYSLNGMEGGMFRYEKKIGENEPIRHADVTVIFEDTLFTFVYEAPSAVFEEYEPIFLKSLDSIQFYPENVKRFWHKVLIEKVPGTIDLSINVKVEGKIDPLEEKVEEKKLEQ